MIYNWDQTYSASAYRKLMLSYSGTQMMDQNKRESLPNDIAFLIMESFAGVITRPLVVTKQPECPSYFAITRASTTLSVRLD